MPGTGRTGRWRRYMAAALRHRAYGAATHRLRRDHHPTSRQAPRRPLTGRHRVLTPTMDSAHHRLLTILCAAQYRVSRGRKQTPLTCTGRSCGAARSCSPACWHYKHRGTATACSKRSSARGAGRGQHPLSAVTPTGAPGHVDQRVGHKRVSPAQVLPNQPRRRSPRAGAAPRMASHRCGTDPTRSRHKSRHKSRRRRTES